MGNPLNPLEVENRGTDGFEASANNQHDFVCRTRRLNSVVACHAQFSALANTAAKQAHYRASAPAYERPGVNQQRTASAAAGPVVPQYRSS